MNHYEEVIKNMEETIHPMVMMGLLVTLTPEHINKEELAEATVVTTKIVAVLLEEYKLLYAAYKVLHDADEVLNEAV